MNDHFAVTISDRAKTRHYVVKKSTWQRLASLMLVVVFSSIGYNLVQHRQVDRLVQHSDRLDEELVWYSSHNARLNRVIATQNSMLSEGVTSQDLLVQAIGREVDEIERSSGLDTPHQQSILTVRRDTLAERIRIIREMYEEKGEVYSEVDVRVRAVEELIGLGEEAVQDDLLTRVDSADVVARRARVMHDNIPNGYPVDGRYITSKYGHRVHPVTKLWSMHKGVDLRAKGQEVYATAAGIVREANYSKLSGNRVIILHNFGFESYYAHLGRMDVKPGDVVGKGDVVGISGNSGRSSAPHLHYEIRHLGVATDPHPFLEWEFGSHEIFTQAKDIKWPSLLSLINQQITRQTLRLSQLDLILPESSR